MDTLQQLSDLEQRVISEIIRMDIRERPPIIKQQDVDAKMELLFKYGGLAEAVLIKENFEDIIVAYSLTKEEQKRLREHYSHVVREDRKERGESTED
jgi:hypothetical protein